MASWSHFLPGRDSVNAEELPENIQGSQTAANSSEQIATSSVSAGLPRKFDPSIDTVPLQSLSSSSILAMSQNTSESSVGCIQTSASIEENFGGATETSQIPRRNLTEAFEELYVDTETPAMKKSGSKNSVSSSTNLISPTGVADFNIEPQKASPEVLSDNSNMVSPKKDDVKVVLPQFDLHTNLQRDLSNALVNRVSFYAVIHDINKEATAMAINDESGYNRNPENQQEEYDPLVVAVNGSPEGPLAVSSSMVKVALIDEEKWLLDAISAGRTDDSRSVNACPPTFLQAMGERDYENPLASLSNGSRTQLWKPSRSWWEAKSGKNPWIEPKSHNKRWRYLWPLIHYHKFLAKCIKKLKRNGVDVKTSLSPVSVFLREEVCAVSDHLASVSLFDSEKWMACLQYFNGWTNSDKEAEQRIRELVKKLKLRPLTEPGDVDSTLLRSQIDDQYLRAMASARAQMAGPGAQEERRTPRPSRQKEYNHNSSRHRSLDHSQSTSGPPPAYPRQNASPANRVPPNVTPTPPNDPRRARWNYPSQPGGQWWSNGWNSNGTFYGDDASASSNLTDASLPQYYDTIAYPGVMSTSYYPTMMYPQLQLPPGQLQPSFDPSMQDPAFYHSAHDVYSSDHLAGAGFIAPTQMGHIPQQSAEQQSVSGTSAAQPTVHNVPAYTNSPLSHPPLDHAGEDHTPYKFNPNQGPVSPYWGHLDQTNLVMMAIATPQGTSSPQTPARVVNSPATSLEGKQENAATMNAQPLLLRQPYYGYGYQNGEGYVPPSPATQFMMSPQTNFAYNYGYGYSPRRPGPQTKPPKTLVEENDTRNDISEEESSTTPPRSTSQKNMENPSKAETIPEGENLS